MSSSSPKDQSQEYPVDSMHFIHPDGTIPPWYRPPPGQEKGPRRLHHQIIAGILIPNEEGRRWFLDKYEFQLADHGRQDPNITMRLRPILQEKGILNDVHWMPRRLDFRDDILIITQRFYGDWEHEGPRNYDEVLDEDRKPIEGQLEEELRKKLLDEVGINASGFKSFYF